MKIATFVKAPKGESRSAFQTWFATEYAPSVVRAAPSLIGAVVRRVIDPPRGTPEAWIVNPEPDFLAFDALLETWCPGEDDFRREVLRTEGQLRERNASFTSYVVQPTLWKDPRIAEAGPHGRRPEITFINPVVRAKDKPIEEVLRHYAEHAPIALRAQRAFTKYEQNVVTSRISWSLDNPPFIDFYSDFSFNSAREQQEKMVSTTEEFQDIVDFVGRWWAVYLSDAEPVASPG